MKMKVVAIASSIQGALLIATSVVVLPTSIRMAEILGAEDFAEAGSPAWFKPWYLAMWHPYVTYLIFLLLGAALIWAGVHYAKPPVVEARWLNYTCWIAAICWLGLATAMVPLAMMGRDWAFGTPAHAVREKVISYTYVIGIEAVLLFGTILSLRHHHKMPSDSKDASL